MTLDRRQVDHLKALGITRWVRRGIGAADADIDEPSDRGDHQAIGDNQEPVANSVKSSVVLADVGSMDWGTLEVAVKNCTACALHSTRTQAVPGTGNRDARWMIIGEAPGEQEDLQGEPFVGRAGVLLDNMLAAVGLDRSSAYIANIIKCRPPNNRDPEPEEIEACIGYLHRQIALVRPRMILVVGRIAAQSLLQTDSPVGRLRGRLHYYGSEKVPLVVTYHPAYLLRRPAEKAKGWEDLKLAMSSVKSVAEQKAS